MENIKAIYHGVYNGDFKESRQFDYQDCEKVLKKAHEQLGEDAEDIIALVSSSFELQGFATGFKFAVQLMAECMPDKGGDFNV